MNWLLWFGLIVTTWRVTRLLVKDEFPPVRALRDWVINSLGRIDSSGALAGGESLWTVPVGITLGMIGAGLGAVTGAIIYFNIAEPWAVAAVSIAVASLWGLCLSIKVIRAQITYSVAYVFTCHWCMSFWVAVALWWVAVGLGFSVPLPWVMVAAASGVTGLMGTWDARLDQTYEATERKLGR